MTIHKCSIFQQDLAPWHTSKRSVVWIKKHFQLLEWPENSPGLNPIENSWQIMKKKLAQKKVSSLLELEETIKTVWIKKISREISQSLVNSMPKQIADIIKNKDYSIKY